MQHSDETQRLTDAQHALTHTSTSIRCYRIPMSPICKETISFTAKHRRWAHGALSKYAVEIWFIYGRHGLEVALLARIREFIGFERLVCKQECKLAVVVRAWQWIWVGDLTRLKYSLLIHIKFHKMCSVWRKTALDWLAARPDSYVYYHLILL